VSGARRWAYLSLAVLVACSKSETSDEPPDSAQGSPHAYETDFPATESPISEGGRWRNGGADAVDWTNVSTTPHRAIGHQTGDTYTDATAVLNGAWGPNQRVSATVFTNAALNDDCYSEVELRLRTRIAKRSIRGYEISFKVSDASTAYLIIVRWNGPVGDFTYLQRNYGAQYGVKNGDVVSATIVDNVITAYKNGTMMGEATDPTFAQGSPGMGFNLENRLPACRGTNDRYGFSTFSATDTIAP
jgi:hypothetical protein